MTWQVTFADSATPIQGVKSSKGKLLEECSKLYYEYFFNDEPKHNKGRVLRNAQL